MISGKPISFSIHGSAEVFMPPSYVFFHGRLEFALMSAYVVSVRRGSASRYVGPGYPNNTPGERSRWRDIFTDDDTICTA